MKVEIESLGTGKLKVRNPFGEVAYLDYMPRNGACLRFAGSNGPVNRVIELPSNLPVMACDCGSLDVSWHGSKTGWRTFCCDDCAKHFDL